MSKSLDMVQIFQMLEIALHYPFSRTTVSRQLGIFHPDYTMHNESYQQKWHSYNITQVLETTCENSHYRFVNKETASALPQRFRMSAADSAPMASHTSHELRGKI